MKIGRAKLFPSIGRDRSFPDACDSMAVDGSKATPSPARTMPTAVDIDGGHLGQAGFAKCLIHDLSHRGLLIHPE